MPCRKIPEAQVDEGTFAERRIHHNGVVIGDAVVDQQSYPTTVRSSWA